MSHQRLRSFFNSKESVADFRRDVNSGRIKSTAEASGEMTNIDEEDSEK